MYLIVFTSVQCRSLFSSILLTNKRVHTFTPVESSDMFAGGGAFCHPATFSSVIKGPLHGCNTTVLIYALTALMYIHSGMFVCVQFHLHGMCVSFPVLRWLVHTFRLPHVGKYTSSTYDNASWRRPRYSIRHSFRSRDDRSNFW